MFQKLENLNKPETIASYLGLLSHGNTYRIQQEDLFWN